MVLVTEDFEFFLFRRLRLALTVGPSFSTLEDGILVG